MTKEQALKKMALLAEQMRKHAEASGLQVFIFHEAGDGGITNRVGYYKPSLVQALSTDLLVNHGDLVAEVLKVFRDTMEKRAPAAATPDSPSLVYPADASSTFPIALSVVSRDR